jgi:hypothetical protein
MNSNNHPDYYQTQDKSMDYRDKLFSRSIQSPASQKTTGKRTTATNGREESTS